MEIPVVSGNINWSVPSALKTKLTPTDVKVKVLTAKQFAALAVIALVGTIMTFTAAIITGSALLCLLSLGCFKLLDYSVSNWVKESNIEEATNRLNRVLKTRQELEQKFPAVFQPIPENKSREEYIKYFEFIEPLIDWIKNLKSEFGPIYYSNIKEYTTRSLLRTISHFKEQQFPLEIILKLIGNDLADIVLDMNCKLSVAVEHLQKAQKPYIT